MSKSTRIGKFIEGTLAGEKYKAYMPPDLPPKPPLEMEDLYSLLEKANTALGRLDGISMVLPDPTLFIYMYVRKEAVLSSQIEGTQSSLSDLLLYESNEAPGAPTDDVTEVSNYVSAMNYGLKRLEKFPLSLRMIREIHEKLMDGGRGGQKRPGEFRQSQNWIGGTRPSRAKFVPPPPEKLLEILGTFETFLHDETVKLPILIRAALAHVQFETIHPFIDGNGRLGRLLITFMLCHDGVLKQPLLYLSLYFKGNRDAYYEHLQAVRTKGEWEEWIQFFLQGVIDTAHQATETAQAMMKLFKTDRDNIEKSDKSTVGVMAIHNYFQKHPVSGTSKIRKECDLSLPTVLRSLATLEELDIIHEITGKERHKIFVYQKYMDILNRGTEPLTR